MIRGSGITIPGVELLNLDDCCNYLWTTKENNALDNVKFHQVELAQQDVKMAIFNRAPKLNILDPWLPMLDNALSYSLWPIDEAWEQEGGKHKLGSSALAELKVFPSSPTRPMQD